MAASFCVSPEQRAFFGYNEELGNGASPKRLYRAAGKEHLTVLAMALARSGHHGSTSITVVSLALASLAKSHIGGDIPIPVAGQ